MSGSPDQLTGVCVIGRSDFHTGIGTVTQAALELFSRIGPVCFLSMRDRPVTIGTTVTLPDGRLIPVVQQASGFAVYFYCDVLWNGAADLNYTALPSDGLKIAHMAYDSDELPPEWVSILNDRFDLALFTSQYLEGVARRSGVRIPVGTLPVGLDVEALIARRYTAAQPRRVRLGTVSAFHERKRLDLLVESFIEAFGDRRDVELVIHSNLAMGETLGLVRSLTERVPEAQITITHGNLSDAAKNDLIASMDVYVSTSSGEGYSIGPREAMALGKPLVLSAIPAHRELGGLPGIFLVEPSGPTPARYPEIDNRVFGHQSDFTVQSFTKALQAARDFAISGEASATAGLRKAKAAEYTYTSLAAPYQNLVNPDAIAVRPGAPWSTAVHFPRRLPLFRGSQPGATGRAPGPRNWSFRHMTAGSFPCSTSS
jgi:glycosyltransferase involved in cell wall biosynthesis